METEIKRSEAKENADHIQVLEAENSLKIIKHKKHALR
jgi:hypothetical protein